jgi:hypothetical protein
VRAFGDAGPPAAAAQVRFRRDGHPARYNHAPPPRGSPHQPGLTWLSLGCRRGRGCGAPQRDRQTRRSRARWRRPCAPLDP